MVAHLTPNGPICQIVRSRCGSVLHAFGKGSSVQDFESNRGAISPFRRFGRAPSPQDQNIVSSGGLSNLHFRAGPRQQEGSVLPIGRAGSVLSQQTVSRDKVQGFGLGIVSLMVRTNSSNRVETTLNRARVLGFRKLTPIVSRSSREHCVRLVRVGNGTRCQN